MSTHTTSDTSHGYRCSSAAEPPTRSPHFFLAVHITGGVIHDSRHLAKCPCPSTTIQDSYAILCHSGETFMYLHLPYVTILHHKTTESQRYVHRGLHLQLP